MTRRKESIKDRPMIPIRAASRVTSSKDEESGLEEENIERNSVRKLRLPW